MANTALTEYLQFHGQGSKTGCISVQREGGGGGYLYLLHGNVVYAETEQGSGLFAFFSMLGWEDVTIEWHPEQPAPKIAFEEPIDTLLFQYAQLEDSGQTTEAALLSLFGASEKSNTEIKLTELKNYLISFEVMNSDFKGFVFHLEKEVTLVGRVDDCDVILPDSTVSSHHCTITQERNCVRVADLGSTNGTAINGKLISEAILQVGDELNIGMVGLKMSMKLQRQLSVAPREGANEQSAPIPVNPRDRAKLLTTQKVNPNVMLAKKSTGQIKPVKGPITWKNIDDTPAKQKSGVGSILGRMFKK
jgi:pSer/pThr/pTyr-binding forkhead associated (FHA) protein